MLYKDNYFQNLTVESRLYWYYHTSPYKQKNLNKIVFIFLFISLNVCFGCSKEPSHGDGSFEYPQHMFWMRNEKNNFNRARLSGGVSCCVCEIVSSYS